MVDDNQDSAESLTILLSLAGNETQTAFDGLEAMEYLVKYLEELRGRAIGDDLVDFINFAIHLFVDVINQ